MSILVTGGTGVFGSHVVRQLVQEGERPVVLSTRGDTTLIKDVASRVTLVRGDILDIPFLCQVVKENQIKKIAHLSAVFDQWSPPYALEVNVKGTVNLLEMARIFGIERVVYTSTKGVYGKIESPYGYPEYRPLPADHPVDPESVYAATKYAGETLGRNYEKNYGLQFITLRFSSSYGPGKLDRHGPMGIHSKLVENAMSGTPTYLPYGADEHDDMVYVKDVAQSIVCALRAAHPASRTYNIGAGVGVTIKQFADILSSLYPQTKIEVGPGLKYMSKDMPSRYFISDISTARDELSYEPKFNLESGIGDYIATMELLGMRPTPMLD